MRLDFLASIARSAGLAALIATGGCSDTLLAEDYVTSCTADAECVSVLVGDMCDCACNSGAINVVDQARYDEDRADISCGSQCGPCPSAPAAVCADGRCAVSPSR